MNERKFINEAVKKLLVSEYIKKETENAGFGGMEMKRTPFGTNITLHVNKPGLVIGRHGSKVQQITENLERKYKLESPQIEVKEIDNPDLNPQVVSKKIALSLEKGWAYRKAGNTSLRRIVESGARGVIISVSGKLSGERGRMQKFMSGSVKYSGEPARAGMERGFSVAKLKLGVIGVKVGILKNDYKLPDDYIVSEKLGVSTPQLIQEDETGKPVVEQTVKMPEEKPRGRPGQRGTRRPGARTEDKRPRARPEAPKTAPEVKPAAEPAKVEAKPEVKEAPAAKVKPEAAPEAEKVTEKVEPVKEEPKKAEPKKEEPKKEEAKPEEPKAAEEPKEKPKAKKATAAKEGSAEKPAAKKAARKTTKKAEPKKEEPKKEEKVEEDGAKSEATKTDEQ